MSSDQARQRIKASKHSQLQDGLSWAAIFSTAEIGQKQLEDDYIKPIYEAKLTGVKPRKKKC